MQRKDLESLGLTAEAIQKAELPSDLIDKIMGLHGKDIEIHKSKLATLEGERDNLQTQLSDASKQIEGFKGMKSPEDVEKAISDWKVKLDDAQKTYASQVAALKFDHALSDALTGAKVKNPKAVKALLNSDALKLNEADGSIIGLDDQITKLKESDAYLFAEPEGTVSLVKGGSGDSVLGDNFLNAALRGAGINPDGK